MVIRINNRTGKTIRNGSQTREDWTLEMLVKVGIIAGWIYLMAHFRSLSSFNVEVIKEDQELEK